MQYGYEVGDPVVCVNDSPDLSGRKFLTLGKIYKIKEFRSVPRCNTALGPTDLVVVIENFPYPIHDNAGFHPARFKRLRKANVDIFKLADRPVPVPTPEPVYV